MITHYSSKIQNAIQRELFQASSSVKLAMAWFTNDLLFQTLLLKLNLGVSVEIILNDDDINRNGETSIDFTEFINNGGILRWNQSNRLMHDKFCIIDDRVIIFGSYNWTLKAEYNDESISIAKDEPSTLDFYKKKFEDLSERFSSGSILNTKGKNEEVFIKGNRHTENIKLTPIHQGRYQSLNFYNSIEIIDITVWENKRYVFGNLELNNGNSGWVLLNNDSFLPETNFIFRRYKYYEKDSDNKILLCVNDKWGLYDIEEKFFVLRPQYEELDICSSEIGNKTFRAKKNNCWGIINERGQEILPFEYEKILPTNGGYEVTKQGKTGLWSNGKFIFECIFDRFSNNGKHPSTLNGVYGVLYYDKIKIPFEYEEIEYVEPFGHGYHYLKKNGKWGRHNCWNDKFIPCIYDSMIEANDGYEF